MPGYSDNPDQSGAKQLERVGNRHRGDFANNARESQAHVRGVLAVGRADVRRIRERQHN